MVTAPNDLQLFATFLRATATKKNCASALIIKKSKNASTFYTRRHRNHDDSWYPVKEWYFGVNSPYKGSVYISVDVHELRWNLFDRLIVRLFQR